MEAFLERLSSSSACVSLPVAPPAQLALELLSHLRPGVYQDLFSTYGKRKTSSFHQGDPGLRLYQVLCLPQTHGRTIEHLPLAKIPFLLTARSSPGEGKCFLRSS